MRPVHHNIYRSFCAVPIFLLIFLSMVACGNVPPLVDNYRFKCENLRLDSDIIQCYNQATSTMLARRIATGTRRFSDGDWPYTFQMLIQLEVESSGHFVVDSVLRSSGSRQLDNKILQALGSVDELFVPRNELFQSHGYSRLKLLIKPARTPLLGEEQLVDDGALVIYVNKVRR